MNRSGEHTLASGNVIRWELTETASRGTCQMAWENDPTQEDEVEALAFAREIMPAEAVRADVGHGDKQQLGQLRDDFLYGGSSN